MTAKYERLYVIVHDYVRRQHLQAYPAERRSKLAMCRELGLVRAPDPKTALERAERGEYSTTEDELYETR